MITQRTKVQLIIFVIITLVGVSYVGARYARLDRLFYDDAFTVTASFSESGGIYEGAEVAYRGVKVGQVEELVATDEGVSVKLGIDNKHDEIPSDALAIVANRSALGEQYVDLQPQTDQKPYLKEGSKLAEPNPGDWTPISTATLLANISTTVSDLPQDAMRTVVEEMGIAFFDTGDDLGQIIDTSNAFIETANEHFDTTLALIRDSRVVLDGQLAKASAIRSFSENLALFSGTLAGSDKDLRTLINRGGATATVLRRFLEDHGVEISQLINNLVTTGKVVVRHLPSLEMLLIAYPYAVEGGYTVASKQDGRYIASFGLVFTSYPEVCREGYGGTDRRPPTDGSWRDMAVNAHCAEGFPKNSRGAQWAPRPAAADGSPTVGTYDQSTGKVAWSDAPSAAGGGSPAPDALGAESWKWLYLQPIGQ